MHYPPCRPRFEEDVSTGLCSPHYVQMVQKETALETPLVAQGKQLGRQLASAAEAQHAKRRAPSAPRHAEVSICSIWAASQYLPLNFSSSSLPQRQHVAELS